MTILGWSGIGTCVGIGAVRYVSHKYPITHPKQIRRVDAMRMGALLGSIALFTFYGYGTANQRFVTSKLKIVEEHSIDVSGTGKL